MSEKNNFVAVRSFCCKAFAVAMLVLVAGCGGGGSSNSVSSSTTTTSPLSEIAALGERIFHDNTLSASGKQSCASCHDPRNAYAQSNLLSVQLGGPNGDQP